MDNEQKTWTLFNERLVEFFVMNEKEKAKKIIKILNKIYPKHVKPLEA